MQGVECEKDYTGPGTNMQAFRELLKQSRNLVVLTGAGVSAESGVPTFRGAGGLWRRWQAQVRDSFRMKVHVPSINSCLYPQVLFCTIC